jgi:hypothetical protein
MPVGRKKAPNRGPELSPRLKDSGRERLESPEGYRDALLSHSIDPPPSIEVYVFRT